MTRSKTKGFKDFKRTLFHNVCESDVEVYLDDDEILEHGLTKKEVKTIESLEYYQPRDEEECYELWLQFIRIERDSGRWEKYETGEEVLFPFYAYTLNRMVNHLFEDRKTIPKVTFEIS